MTLYDIYLTLSLIVCSIMATITADGPPWQVILIRSVAIISLCLGIAITAHRLGLVVMP